MRTYRDWQFFNRVPQGSQRLMQACYTGKLWEFGLAFDPARIWLQRLSSKEHKFVFTFHLYLPFAQWGDTRITYFGRPSIGWRWNGKWHKLATKVRD